MKITLSHTGRNLSEIAYRKKLDLIDFTEFKEFSIKNQLFSKDSIQWSLEKQPNILPLSHKVTHPQRFFQILQVYTQLISSDIIFFFLIVVEHMSICGATGTPVLEFWWCLLWVSKPEWVLPYSNFAEVYMIYVPWDSPLVRHLCQCIMPA